MLLVFAAVALGQDSRNIDVNGFLMGNFSGRITGQKPMGDESSDFLLAEERLRLDINAWSESIEASATAIFDIFHDAIADDFNIDFREAYADYTTGDFDFRLGRQIATWGIGDLLFINDVFPKDWVSFFSGRPLEYLKIGVDGLRTRYSSSIMNAELFVIPFFQPDNFPTSDRFYFFDPFASAPVNKEEKPGAKYENTELALRLYRTISNIDLSVYAYRGFWRVPSMRPDDLVAPTRVTAFYPPLSVYGMSAQGNVLGGVASFEAGYYHSRADENKNIPSAPGSQTRFFVGYQRQPWNDTTLGIQYYTEITEGRSDTRYFLPTGFPARQKYRDIVTFRADQLLKHQTWKLSMMCFYSPADSDYLLQPQAAYKFSDNLAATLGGNIFGGKREWTSFGRFEKNDNVYVSVRFDF